jgi:hypothetical protein
MFTGHLLVKNRTIWEQDDPYPADKKRCRHPFLRDPASYIPISPPE